MLALLLVLVAVGLAQQPDGKRMRSKNESFRSL